MRRKAIVIVLLFACSSIAVAQPRGRDTLISLNPFGPLYGLYAVTVEQRVASDLTAVIAPAYYNLHYSAFRTAAPDGYRAWHAGARIGVNYYPGMRAPAGFFAGGHLRAGYLSLRDGQGSAEGIFVSPSLVMGFRVFAGRIGIAPRLRLGYAVPFFDYSGIDAGNQMLYGPTALEWDLGVGLAFAF